MENPWEGMDDDSKWSSQVDEEESKWSETSSWREDRGKSWRPKHETQKGGKSEGKSAGKGRGKGKMKVDRACVLNI